jgi:outer membrane protein TolC
MKRGSSIGFVLLFVLCLTKAAVAQVEKQAQTYDLTMEDCLASVLTRNPEIQQLRVDVERAAGTRLVYRSRALPQLATQLSAGGRGGDLYIPPQIKAIFTNSVTVLITNNAAVIGPALYSLVTAQFSQPLFDAGVPPSLRRGRLEVIVAQQNLNRAATDRLHEGRLIFLLTLYLRDLVAVHDELDKHLQANVQSEQQRLDVGAGNEAALKSAKIQQLNLELALANLRGYYFSTVTRLAEVCGRDPAQGTNGPWRLSLPKPVGALRYEPVKMDRAQEFAYALQHRADLKLLQAVVDATAADRQTVQGAYLPTISLVASGLFFPQSALVSKQTDIVPGQDTRTSQLEAGVAMSWTVIDNGQVTGASRQLAATQQAYEIMLHKLEQNIPRELATIEGALQSADERRVAFLKSAEAAEENLRLVEAQVSLGEATQLDFLKAQGNLLSVRAGLAEALHSHEEARAELDRATGRYLQYVTAPAP